MAMRMSPQAAQQNAFPAINRSSLVFFGGFVLIVLNLFWQNTGAIAAIFTPGAAHNFTQLKDTGLQVLGLGLLTLLSEYGGENAGTAALVFIGVLWLLWLLTHFGTQPGGSEPAPTHTEAQPQAPSNSPIPDSGIPGISGGSGGQKK